jgi:hypothetical protein
MLRADCGQCAALCCAHHAFDRSDKFAIDKPAGVPCPNLSGAGRCEIHGSLEVSGFSGCASYDCLGAGQHVVQGLFGGRSWQAEPALKKPMFEAFRVMRQVHELLVLLREARRLPLTDAQSRQCAALEAELLPHDGWSLTRLAAFERGPLPGRMRAFLPSLRNQLVGAEEIRKSA